SIQLEGLRAVFDEHGRSDIRKCRIVDLLVGFQVPLEAPAVEVARADGNPVVAHSHLSVQHAWLILENADAVAKELSVESSCGVTHPRMIRQRTGNHESDIHAAACRATQRLAEAP